MGRSPVSSCNCMRKSRQFFITTRYNSAPGGGVLASGKILLSAQKKKTTSESAYSIYAITGRRPYSVR